MPVDVATGAVTLTRTDVRIPGRVELTWERTYDTALLGEPPSPLGPGWAVRYFAALRRVAAGYELLTPEGGTFVFEDPAGDVERGRVVRSLGTFQELRRDGAGYVVVRWNVDDGTIERYLFRPGGDGRPARLAAVEDVCGVGLDLAYDPAGRLASVTQRAERRGLHLTYLASGRLGTVAFRSAAGTEALVRYEYDPAGRLVADTDASGYADRYEYDAAGRVVREAVKDGGVFTYAYDGKGRCGRYSGAGRYNEKTFRYVDAARVTYVTNSVGNTSTFQSLPTGQVVVESDPAGRERRTEFDEHGRVVAEIAPRGGVTRYGYDEAGNRTSITDPLGHGYEFVYNGARLPVALINPNGHVWTREYDARNRLTVSQNPLGAGWTFRYDEAGNATVITGPTGGRIVQRFENGQVVEKSDWAGNVTRFGYDHRGRLAEWTDPAGNRVRVRYDAAGNPVEVLRPDGTTTSAAYDAGGNLTAFTDAGGKITRYKFAPCGRIVEQANPDGTRIEYLWGTEPGRLAGILNENGETFTLVWDECGRVAREVGFDGRERRFAYDPDGNCAAVTNGNGERVVMEFDPVGRLIGRRLPDGSEARFAYDPAGKMVAASTPDATVALEYDPTGRVVREAQGGDWVASEYDPAGRLARTSTSLGHEVRYRTDAAGRLAGLTTAGGGRIEFRRDPRGLDILRTLPGGAELAQQFDPLARLTEQTVAPARSDGRELVRRSFAYEPSGVLRSVRDGTWGQTDYAYDPAERLLRADTAGGPREAFGYDPAGSLTEVRRAGFDPLDEDIPRGPGGRIVRRGDVDYEYDGNGRVVRMTRGRGGDPPEVWRYVWDALDRLRAVVRPDGERWEYKYDAFGRRVEKAGAGRRTRFVWDREVVVHEVEDGDASAWVFDPDGFAPLAKVRGGELYPVVTDHLGTPREVLDPGGAVARRAAHRAWGEVDRERLTDPAAGCPVRYPGQWADDELGLHYNWYRYYDPRTGTYLSQDPLGFVGGINPYQYTVSPVNGIDPLGLICHTDTNGGKGYAVYAIVDKNGRVVYVGITNNFAVRQSQHAEPGGRIAPGTGRSMVQIDSAANYGQARGYEQAWIGHFGTRDTSVAGTSPATNPANRCWSFEPSRADNPSNPRDNAFGQAYRDKWAALGH